jgi:hypothetical protein
MDPDGQVRGVRLSDARRFEVEHLKALLPFGTLVAVATDDVDNWELDVVGETGASPLIGVAGVSTEELERRHPKRLYFEVCNAAPGQARSIHAADKADAFVGTWPALV